MHPYLKAAKKVQDPKRRHYLQLYADIQKRARRQDFAREAIDEYWAAVSRVARLFPGSKATISHEVRSFLRRYLVDLPERELQIPELTFLARVIGELEKDPRQQFAVDMFETRARIFGCPSAVPASSARSTVSKSKPGKKAALQVETLPGIGVPL